MMKNYGIEGVPILDKHLNKLMAVDIKYLRIVKGNTRRNEMIKEEV